ncbi:MerR family transcriptional regulator [Rhodococcus triatomae]|uniref:DNA-binding transcriptional regulator, MerR family n=1 Tax=Rhodococcus triatomae TaxID=300028 RepID=A0A1G8FPU2_9NOCA|nr:MerR family transcriptional regulator [Rhodococcus triatomae]QNG19543.1 MerR family transcriptional regulator [Rhodococcus triatomae]QNG24542.1 MerR family transcriptional regulator [Rhodococcus triatomae]SDH84178.1 DNA-binding transcriptional regulator, MerR family [Rhodococcus triatomae]
MLIGELARKTGTSPRLLRYYEQQGLLDASRQPNGYRDYAEDATEVVHRIRLLLDAGLNTESIRSLLPCVHGDDPSIELCSEVDDLLRREIREVREQIELLTRRQRNLERLVEGP